MTTCLRLALFVAPGLLVALGVCFMFLSQMTPTVVAFSIALLAAIAYHLHYERGQLQG